MKNYTVGELLKYIKEFNIPMDAEIAIQRIHDVYFEKHGWDKNSIKMKGYWYNYSVEQNNKILNGEYDDKEQYPLYDKEKEHIYSEKDLELMKEEYVTVSSPVFYKEMSNVLFLDAHY